MRLQDIRKQMYDYNKAKVPFIFEWPWYIYRRYKVIIFMESASLLVFVLLKTPVTPNMLTMLYIILGITSGVLLALSSKITVTAAVVLFFLKPALDWSDGLLARIKNQSSVTGDILDHYSPLTGWLCLWAGLGIYLGNSFNSAFYYLTPILPVLFAGDIYKSTEERFIYSYFSRLELRRINQNQPSQIKEESKQQSLIRRIKGSIDTFFEYNTKTVDIVCLLLAVEVFFSIHVVWVFYLLFLLWQLIVFVSRLAIVFRGGWAEKELDRLKKALYG